MSCALCKDEFTMRKDVSARGATKPTVNVVRHLCPTCETKLAVSGHGKAKRDVVTHVCTSGGAKGPTCCSTK